MLQAKFSDVPEPGFVPLGDSNFSYYIAVPTSLRVDPGYSKVTTTIPIFKFSVVKLKNIILKIFKEIFLSQIFKICFENAPGLCYKRV